MLFPHTNDKPSTLQHVPSFSALHGAMTAIQQCPVLELSPLTLCVNDLDKLADALRWVTAQCAEHIPFGERSPSHHMTALLTTTAH